MAGDTKKIGDSPNSKKSRGIDKSLITTWVDANLSEQDNKICTHAAKTRNITLSALLSGLLKDALKEVWPGIKEDADQWEPTVRSAKPMEEMTLEELEKEQRRLIRLQDKAAATMAAINELK